MRPKCIVDLKTFIPEKNVWVSTVAWDIEIGVGRKAESMIFKGNKDGITDWEGLYFESHGYTTNKEVLEKLHRKIVESVKKGEIKLTEVSEG